jgi:hypothetical protein
MGDDERERDGHAKTGEGDDKRQRWFAVTPLTVLADPRISWGATALYGTIYSLSQRPGKRYCTAGNGHIAKCMGCDERTIQRFLKELEDAGLAERSVERDASGRVTERRLLPTVWLGEAAGAAGKDGEKEATQNLSLGIGEETGQNLSLGVQNLSLGPQDGIQNLSPLTTKSVTTPRQNLSPSRQNLSRIEYSLEERREERGEKKAAAPPDRASTPSAQTDIPSSLFSAQESIQERKPAKQYPEPTSQDLKDWGILREPECKDVSIDGRYEILEVPETVEEALKGIAAYASIQAVPAGPDAVPVEPEPVPGFPAVVEAPAAAENLREIVADLEDRVRAATRRWVTHFDRTDSGIARIVAGPPEDRRRELKSLLWTPDGKELACPKGTWSDVVGASREITSLEGSLSAARRRLAAAFAGMPYMDLAKVVSSTEDEKGRAGRSWQESDGVRPVTLPAWTDERESALAAATAARDAAKPAWEAELRAEQEAGKAAHEARKAAMYDEWRHDAQSKPAREPEALLRLWRSECRRLRNCGKFQAGKEELALAGDCLRRLDADDVGAKESGPVREILLRRWIRWHAKESLDGNSHKYTLSVGDLLVSWAAFRRQERVQDYRDLGTGGLRGWLEGVRSEAKRAVAA